MKTENKNGLPIKVADQQRVYSASAKMLIRQYDYLTLKTCVFRKFSDEFVGQSIGFSVINQSIISDRSNYGRELCHMPINNLNQIDGKTNERYALNAWTKHLHLDAPVTNLVGPSPL